MHGLECVACNFAVWKIAEQKPELSGEEAAEIPHQKQAAYNKELGELQAVLDTASSIRRIEEESEELKRLERDSGDDPEMRTLAEQERRQLMDQVD